MLGVVFIMEKLAFVLWVLLWPLVCSITGYLHLLYKLKVGKKYDEGKLLFVSIVQLIIWIWVAKSI
jgi:hypothetical protein